VYYAHPQVAYAYIAVLGHEMELAAERAHRERLTQPTEATAEESTYVMSHVRRRPVNPTRHRKEDRCSRTTLTSSRPW
jgi:hypothetical protein